MDATMPEAGYPLDTIDHDTYSTYSASTSADEFHQMKGDTMFSEQELTYLQGQRLARIATVDADGQPTVDAVGFSLDDGKILIGTHSPVLTRKYRNVMGGNTNVALIVDDLASVQPWRPRGIKIHGVAEVVERNGHFGPGSYLVITPKVSWSWGIEPHEGGFGAKKTVW